MDKIERHNRITSTLLFILVLILCGLFVQICRMKDGYDKQMVILNMKVVDISKQIPQVQKTDFTEVDKNIVDLSCKIKGVSDSVSMVRADLITKEQSLRDGINNAKAELEKKNQEADMAIKRVGLIVDSAIIQLNSLKKVTDEDRARVQGVIKDLELVKLQFKALQDQINDMKLMFGNYDMVLRLQKAGIKEIGGGFPLPDVK